MDLIQARIESKDPPKVCSPLKTSSNCSHSDVFPQVKDLLQLMIDATSAEGDADKKLNIEDIAGFSIDFLLGGYTSTANTLSYTTYLLAMNPDVQEKLQAEIDQQFEEDPVSDTSKQVANQEKP